MLGVALASPGHAAQKPAPAPKPAVKVKKAKEHPPVKRQNFRARSADEISPGEGFEDCAFGVPCVGPTFNPRWN
ncbi:MAG: hypothetical protein AB7U38_15070 [Hyphomicrobiales bacterium]